MITAAPVAEAGVCEKGKHKHWRTIPDISGLRRAPALALEFCANHYEVEILMRQIWHHVRKIT